MGSPDCKDWVTKGRIRASQDEIVVAAAVWGWKNPGFDWAMIEVDWASLRRWRSQNKMSEAFESVRVVV